VSQHEKEQKIKGKVLSFVESGHHWELPTRREISTRIAIKAQRKILFIDAAEIVAVEARGNYVVLHHKSGSYTLRMSISDAAEKLRSFGFVRIHRSFVVNSRFAKEIQALPTGEYLLRIEGGNEYTVTRSYKDNVRLLAASWLGLQFAP
jgi:DNA-binding LytR/AlgR family response regulator